MSLKKQAISGLIWTFSQQFSVRLISFGVQIILARLLMPEMFGLIAMINVFVTIGQTLMTGGMTSSLIRTKRPDQLDYSTVFSTNIVISILVYIIIFICAPFIADFFDQQILVNIVRVLSLTFVIRSLVAVHVAKLTKEMNFKLQMKLQIPSTIIGAIVGVTMAYSGYGVWSLVGLNVIQTLAFTIQYWLFAGWKPSLLFNKRRFKYHFNFGYKMTLSGLLNSIYSNTYNIVIGKFFSPAMAGFYTQAENMRVFPVNQLSLALGKVTYPLFANLKTDAQLKNAYKATMKAVLFIVIPTMFILIIVAEEVFLMLYGEKWLPAVPYFKILAVASVVRPISNYNLNILKVKGRSDLFLKVEVIKKVLGLAVIAVALPFGMIPLIFSLTAVTYVFAVINMSYGGKMINYTTLEQIKNISGLFAVGALVAVGSYFMKTYIENFTHNNFLIILSVGCAFVIPYAVILLYFDKNLMHILRNILKK